MPSLWQHVLGRLDRSKNPRWGWRVSVLYGMGIWTMLGYVFMKWMSEAGSMKAAHFGMTQEKFKELTEEEINVIIKKRNLDFRKRQQELAEYVAENLYTPGDFMG